MLCLENVTVELTYRVLDKHHQGSIALPSKAEILGVQLTIVLEDKARGSKMAGLWGSAAADDAVAEYTADLPEEHADGSVTVLNP